MKNVLMLDLDTSRKDAPLIVSKPNGHKVPETKEKAAEMVRKDMSTLCEAVCTLIHVAEQHGFEKSHVSLKRCIDHLQKGFADASYEGLFADPTA